MSKSPINRGVELILNGGKRKQEAPKTFHIVFGKLVGFLNREVEVYLDFSLDLKKRNSQGRKKC